MGYKNVKHIRKYTRKHKAFNKFKYIFRGVYNDFFVNEKRRKSSVILRKLILYSYSTKTARTEKS